MTTSMKYDKEAGTAPSPAPGGASIGVADTLTMLAEQDGWALAWTPNNKDEECNVLVHLPCQKVWINWSIHLMWRFSAPDHQLNRWTCRDCKAKMSIETWKYLTNMHRLLNLTNKKVYG